MTSARNLANRGGPIAFMAGNPIAANLLMVFLLIAGLFAAGDLVQEMLPDASLDLVQVVVPYPGAAPEEVEQAIVRKIEEEIGSVEGVRRIEASAAEGLGSVLAEFKTGTDISRALNEVKARVDRIPSFPAGAERPEVREVTSRQSVIRLLVHGDVPERTLKELAYSIEDGIALLPEVSHVETSGVREYEISIEVPSHRLRSLGLTLDDVASAVRRGSIELSAGKISTGDEEIRVRTIGQNYTQQDFGEIVVLSRPDGTSLRLRDIAELRDGCADTELVTRFNGNRAVRVDVSRTADEQVLEIAEAVRAYLAAEVIPALPEGVAVEIWRDDTTLVGSRLSLLLENGVLGLVLVFLGLTLFLEIRLAVWVGAGLVVSLVGTLWVMLMPGISINMFSMLALVLALGIVVDDAIVVGENIFAERKKGRDGLTTAIRGTRRISGPVIFSVLTTVTAFCALLAVPGPSGKLMRSIPIVVIAILCISLVESLLILPRHLSHLPPLGTRAATGIGRWLSRVQGAVERGLNRLVEGPLDRGLRLATNHPPIVLDLARQVRSAFFGTEALRVLRGREDMRVYVRLPGEERNSVDDIARYVIRTPGGAEVPLDQVATARFTRSSTAIHTVDGRRVITVTANVDSRVANAQQVNVALESEVLEPLAAEHPGFSYDFGGEQRQQRQIVGALSGSLIIVLMVMFALLAIPFGSYTQPLIVMAAIPLGFVGAVLGHLMLGLSFGFMSLQGLVGCFGVVVNDSLVMINFINEKRDSGLEPQDAIILGTKARVRAILLTSVTTFLGVAPLVFERDPAAQHLVPVAAALAFGVLVATPLLMLVVPALMMSQVNLRARLAVRGLAGKRARMGQPA